MKTAGIPPHYVLTGGPCAGKTTLIGELEKRGYGVSPEPGRIYFEEQMKAGRTMEQILSDVPQLERDILRKHVELEAKNRGENVLFFDRGVPDCLAYYRIYNVPEDAELLDAVAAAKYRRVFLLELIENFANDTVRIETPEQAARIHEAIRTAYQENGYELVDVPVMPIKERTEFVLTRL